MDERLEARAPDGEALCWERMVMGRDPNVAVDVLGGREAAEAGNEQKTRVDCSTREVRGDLREHLMHIWTKTTYAGEGQRLQGAVGIT